MDVSTIFIFFALIILIFLYVAYPFYRKINGMYDVSPSPKYANQNCQRDLAKLLIDRDILLSDLDELELDFRIGKVTENNYSTRRSEILQNGAVLLHLIDETGLTNEIQDSNLVGITLHVNETESGNKCYPIEDEYEKMIDQRRRNRYETTSGFCPKCGRPLQKSDRFCPKCGSFFCEE